MANSIYRGAGLALTAPTTTNRIALGAGESMLIPAGSYHLDLGTNLVYQQLDPVTNTWEGTDAGATIQVMSDGVNYRVYNSTGSIVTTTVTSAGSGYTSAPTVVPSAGNAVLTPIIGGAINSTVVINSGGGAYNYTPMVVISAPQTPGIAATATATLTGTAVSAVTIVNAGAGYTQLPTITFVPDSRELVPSGITSANATLSLTGAGTVTGLLITNAGIALGSAPTLTLSGNATATTTLNTTGSTTDTLYIQAL